MGGRSYLSIGDVLSLLRHEFPDVTISKIRFLESQGLVNPERTPSGYRKFYEHDVDRLRWVLRQQREHFLPLKVIKDRLEVEDNVANGSGAGSSPAPSSGLSPSADLAEDLVVPAPEDRDGAAADTAFGVLGSAALPVERNAVAQTPSKVAVVTLAPSPRPTRDAVLDDYDRVARSEMPAAPVPTPGPAKAAPGVPDPPVDLQPPPGPVPTSMVDVAGSRADSLRTLSELSAASGLDQTVLGQLRELGLLVPTVVGGMEYYEAEALAVATLAASFARFGIEPRHLRLYKNAADREAGFVEQVVLPLVRQRNPESRARAVATTEELTGLGQELRAAFLRTALRELLGG